ncbi:MAG TPA: thioredoxin-disulfide reductase [Anaerolineales bacterium]|nr:thioredoxin-disulfide reductase [Anaerolineales bacterium]
MTLNLNSFNFDDEDLETKGPYKVLILGGGPTGLSAALYAARAELQPLVLTGLQIGGQVAITHAVENYPGFPDGVGGPELVELFQKQAERFGAVLEFDTAIEADFSQQPFRVKGYNAIYEAETVIIATGATPRKLEVPGEVEFTGRGVSYCGTCDGWFFKGKDVIVVGGGDSALEEGDFLTRYANSVTVVHRRDELRAGVLLKKRAEENPKMNFVFDTVIEDIRGNGEVQNVELKNLKSGEIKAKEIDGVFIFIGHTPNTEIFQGQLEMDEAGYIRTNMLMETNIPGVFAAGEAADPHFRQVVTSAGMGAAAAIQANRWLQEHSG